MDWLAWLTFTGALLASAVALVIARRGRFGVAVAFLVLAALLLRGNLAARWWLSPWDERYHAVVAKHVMDHPLEPTLVERPLYETTPDEWGTTRVWLHKPPLTMWLMSAGMWLFGVSEPAARLPSVLLSSLGVAVTFALGLRFLGPAAALAAAAFQAWHARSAMLAGGLRATDHVDTVFIFMVGLGCWLGIVAADALAERRSGSWWRVLLAGAVFGLAFLTKDAPALLVPGVFGLRLLQRMMPWGTRIGAGASLVAAGAALILPWRLHTASAFPAAHAEFASRNARYFAETAVEGHAAPWYAYLTDLGPYFGWGSALALVFFCFRGLTRERSWLPLLAWFGVTYVVFSAASTKMDAYVFIASPVIFLALGWFCTGGVASMSALTKAGRRLYLGAIVLVVALYASSASLSRLGPWRPPLRTTLWTQELRYIAEQIDELPGGPWVVLGAPETIEPMFYSSATFVREGPEPRHLAQAERRGFRVAVYDPTDSVGAEVVAIPRDPRTLDAQQLLRELGPERHEALILNARRPRDLEAYLHRHGADVDVRSSAKRDRRVRRAVSRDRPILVLVRPEDPPSAELRARLPEAAFVKSEAYAR